jgi:hypothetical protein
MWVHMCEIDSQRSWFLYNKYCGNGRMDYLPMHSQKLATRARRSSERDRLNRAFYRTNVYYNHSYKTSARDSGIQDESVRFIYTYLYRVATAKSTDNRNVGTKNTTTMGRIHLQSNTTHHNDIMARKTDMHNKNRHSAINLIP